MQTNTSPLIGAWGSCTRDASRHDIPHLDEFCDATRPRAPQHLVARTVLQYAPCVVHDDVVAECVHLAQVVGHEDGGEVEPASKRGDFTPQHRPQRRIERGERLIEQQHPRFGRQRARQRHALLLPTGHLPRLSVRQILKRQHGEQLGDALALLRLRTAGETERNVLRRRHVRKQR
jgi:hypothetical protein